MIQNNDKHPELKPNEIFLVNESNTSHQFENNSCYKTIRCGNIAYDMSGNIMPNYHPVFITLEEFNAIMFYQKFPTNIETVKNYAQIFIANLDNADDTAIMKCFNELNLSFLKYLKNKQ